MEVVLNPTGRLDELGYQAALEAGMSTADLGASDTALLYFRRAVAVRPTSIALTHIGRCLRDLGQLHEAERAYRDALTAVGGDSGHALVGLIAVLCDLCEYEIALPLAQRAALEYPDSAPAQTVAARCFDEFAATLGTSAGASITDLEPARRAAAEMRSRARQLESKEPAAVWRRRRERPFPLPAVYAEALIAHSGQPSDAEARNPNQLAPVSGQSDVTSEGSHQEKPAGVWRRLIRILRGGRGSS